MSEALLFNVLSIHAFSLGILGLVLAHLRNWMDVDEMLRRLTCLLVTVTMAGILCDAASWALDGRPGAAARGANWVFTSLDFLLVWLPAAVWFWMAAYLTDNGKGKVRRLWMRLTAAALLALAAINPFCGVLFRIDARNVYHRGAGDGILFAVSAVFMTLATVKTFRHRFDRAMDFLWPQYFWIPPIACAVVQAAIPGVNLLYMGVTISILMLFIGMQTKSNRLDYLTGVHNRRYLDIYLRDKLRHGTFAAVLMDIDHYKIINDTYGHLIGDEILIAVASILKVSTRNRDCVARYGGDEFVVALDTDSIDVLYAVISRINYQMFQFNNNSEYPFNVSISMGYDLFDPALYRGGRDFIEHIDRLLYKSKDKKPVGLELKNRARARQPD